jgi:hypothetical protein
MVAHDVDLWDLATDNQMIHRRAQEVHMITLIRMDNSMKSAGDGGENNGADSGDDLHEEMAKFAQLGPPLDDWLQPDDEEE